jgi:hypothetical protein
MRKFVGLVKLKHQGISGDTTLTGNEEPFIVSYEPENLEDWYQLQREDLLYGENSTAI